MKPYVHFGRGHYGEHSCEILNLDSGSGDVQMHKELSQ